MDIYAGQEASQSFQGQMQSLSSEKKNKQSSVKSRDGKTKENIWKKCSGQRGEERCLVFYLYFFLTPSGNSRIIYPGYFQNFTFLMQTGRFYEQTNLYIRHSIFLSQQSMLKFREKIKPSHTKKTLLIFKFSIKFPPKKKE